MRTFFIPSRPETIIALLYTGKMPDSLPAYMKSNQIILYDSTHVAVRKTDTRLNQTYIIVVNVPPIKDTHLLQEVQQDGELHLIASQLEVSWIIKIYVPTKAGFNYVNKLTNNNPPVEIEIQPELFPKEIKPVVKSFDSAPSFSAPANKIRYRKQSDLLGSTMQAHVNTVNCVGVMGKGIALAFKKKYPNMFKDYKRRCDRKEVKLGEVYIYRESNGRIIVIFPTKNHWRNDSKLEWIAKGLEYLASHVAEWGITSLAIPALGCGNGKLNWEDVYPLMEKFLAPVNIPIEIHVPFSQPKSRKRPASTQETTAGKGKKRLTQRDASSAVKGPKNDMTSTLKMKKIEGFFSKSQQPVFQNARASATKKGSAGGEARGNDHLSPFK